MSTALRGWNKINVGLTNDLTALWEPLQRPIYRLSDTAEAVRKGLFG